MPSGLNFRPLPVVPCMRQPNTTIELFICDQKEVVHFGGQFDDIIDCTTDGVTHAFTSKVCHVPPSGKNDHNWTVEDLDIITELVAGSLARGRRVLIHCGRGVSRSSCAAAAVLLHLGKSRTIEGAVGKARHPEREPVKTAVAGLKGWWASRQQGRLF